MLLPKANTSSSTPNPILLSLPKYAQISLWKFSHLSFTHQFSPLYWIFSTNIKHAVISPHLKTNKTDKNWNLHSSSHLQFKLPPHFCALIEKLSTACSHSSAPILSWVCFNEAHYSLLHWNCSCHGHQWSSCCEVQWSIPAPHLLALTAFNSWCCPPPWSFGFQSTMHSWFFFFLTNCFFFVFFAYPSSSPQTKSHSY